MKLNAHGVLCGALITVAAAAVGIPAQSVAQQPAEHQADQILDKKLENGLDVIVLPSSTVPIATIEICVKNGAFTEPPEYNGLSHLYEHMFFKGNAVIPNQEAYLARMRELGIVFNGTTSNERVNYFFTLPADKLEEGLVFMRDAITTPQFDADEFNKEKGVVLGEVDRNEASPYYDWGQALDRALWGDLYTRKDALGDRATIKSATIEQMETMKARYYVPNNSALLVSGDVDPDEVFRLASRIFAGWKQKADPFVENPVPAHPPLAENAYVVTAAPVQVPSVSIKWHGPSVDDDPKATFAADVLSYILSQPTSKFQKALVDSGITLNAGLSYYTQRHTGPISLSATARTEKLESAISALLEEIEKFTLPGYFSDEQLESAKTILAIEDLYGRENIVEFTHTVSFWWATASLDYYREYINQLREVTRADINAYVTRYIVGKPFVAGVVVPKSSEAAKTMTPARLKSLATQVGAHTPEGPK